MKILYITYNGLTEPLGRRQVLPYLLGLAARGWKHRVLSFEKAETADVNAREEIAELLTAAGIEWTALRYHRRPTLLATAFDVASGVSKVWRSRGGLGLIHARSTVPAAMANLLVQRVAVPWIFDVRGLVAREYADAGHWARRGFLYRLTDRVERSCLRRASGLVFLTRRIRRELVEAGSIPDGLPNAVVPCAVDLGTFRPSAEARHRVREVLGITSARVLVYSGSLGGWYRIGEMVRFFQVARAQVTGLRFLVLTGQPELARQAIEAAGVASWTHVLKLRPEEVPDYLAAADAGICFLGDHSSKNASSPTKYGEYLASGLPVVTNRWTGDAADLEREPAWLLVDRFETDEYQRVAGSLARLLMAPHETRCLARGLAEREFGLDTTIERYDALYRQILEVPAREA